MTVLLRRAWLAGALALPLLAAGCAVPGLGTTGGAQAKGLDVYGDAPVFALTDQLGRPVQSEDFRDKVVLADFIYTNCPDFCPLLTSRMQALQGRLAQERLLGERVQLLSFTVDPARDTPAVLRAYAEQHQADPAAWRFLTGPEKYLVPLVVQGFRLGVQAAAGQPPEARGPAYNVAHSNRVVLIDRRWRVRAYYDGSDLDPDRTLRDIRALLG